MTELLDFILHHEDQFKSKARLASLYSDFRVQRTTNPDGYAANITAWQKALTDAVDAGKIPTADKVSSAFCLKTGEELVEALEITGYGRPLALGAVMDEAISEGIMIPLQTFLTESKSIYDKSWSAQSRWLISWGLKRLGLAVSPSSKDRLVRGQFVVASSLEKAASKILASKSGRSNRVDRVSSRKMFKQEIEELLELPHRLSDSDLNALLTLLDRDKKEITYSNNVIKFNAVKEPAAITSYDETIASLKTLIADLNLQIDSLASHVNELAEKARMAVKQNNRVSALATLRAKRVSESLISRRSETLAQLEEVFNKIAQAEDQVAFITVMEASTKVLRDLNAKSGGIEKVEDVVAGLRDEMTQVDEIGAVIADAGQENDKIDEGEIDDELETLERQAQLENEERQSIETTSKLTGQNIAAQRSNEEPGVQSHTQLEILSSGESTAPQQETESAPNGNSNVLDGTPSGKYRLYHNSHEESDPSTTGGQALALPIG